MENMLNKALLSEQKIKEYKISILKNMVDNAIKTNKKEKIDINKNYNYRTELKIINMAFQANLLKSNECTYLIEEIKNKNFNIIYNRKKFIDILLDLINYNIDEITETKIK